jgi:ribosomal-protein-alanine N-acetyltransferase
LPVASRDTPRLSLRRITASDAPAIAAMYRDPAVMATLGGVRSAEASARQVEAMAAHWEAHGFGLWAAHERATGAFVGRGGLRRVEVLGNPEVEVAYALVPAFWGLGLASELARESVRVAFAELALPELVAFTLVTNHASRRVIEKLGFRFERGFEHVGLAHVLFRLRREDVAPAATRAPRA